MPSIGDLVKLSRLNAGITQEKAAEYLPASVRSIQRFESGECSVPMDLVPRLAQIYHDPALNIRVLQAYEPWRDALPKIPEASLSEAAAGALEAMDKLIHDEMRVLLRIVRDGSIGAGEEQAWEEITKSVMDAIAWLIALSIYGYRQAPES